MAIFEGKNIWEAYEELIYKNVKAPNDYGITRDAMAELVNVLTERIGNDNRLQTLMQKLADGVATYSDVDEFAVLLGNHLGNALYITMPNYVTYEGFLTKEIADAIIPPGLRANYDAIIEYAKVTQKGLNERARLGLNAVAPDYDINREKGLIEYVTAEPLSDRAASFTEAITENGLYYADETARLNFEYQSKSGLSPKIIRTAEAPSVKTKPHKVRYKNKVYTYSVTYKVPCKWCEGLAGTYDYEKVQATGSDVYRRHEGCRCIIEYSPDGVRRQNVHTKTWATPEEIAQRKAIQPPAPPTKSEIMQKIAAALDQT